MRAVQIRQCGGPEVMDLQDYINQNGGEAMQHSVSISEFLEDKGYTGVKLRRTPTGHLELDATVNGNPARMMVDTGAGVTVIDRASAQRWAVGGEHGGDTAFAACVGDIGGFENATLDKLGLADLELTDVDVKIMDLSQINAGLEKSKAQRIDGIIGSDLMVSRAALIDYATHRLHLRSSDN